MKIIAFVNQKGGVGKTTSTLNIGAGLSGVGRRVLLVDLDPQANLTYSLGVQGHTRTNNTYTLLKGTSTLADTIVELNPVLHLLPSYLDLAAADTEFSSVPGREVLLKETLESAYKYDYILIDCPPSLGMLTLNALVAARGIYIALQVEYLAIQGMAQLMRTIDIVKQRLNNEIEVAGIIATRYDKRKNLNREVLEMIRNKFGNKVFNTEIRDNIALAEAPSHCKSIFEYQPASHGAEDYQKLCTEIIKREELNHD